MVVLTAGVGRLVLIMKARIFIVIYQRLFKGCDGSLVNSSLWKSIPLSDGPIEE